MPNKHRKNLLFTMVTVLAAVAIVSVAVWIMANHLGISEEYDFGAGAYYYADNPQLQDLADQSARSYTTSVPTWVHIILFLAWGWLMWRLWIRVDGKINKKDYGKDNPA